MTNGKSARTVSQDAQMDRADHLLDALGDPTRRAIIERLRDGPRPVVEIADGMRVGRPAISQHLRLLKDAGVVIDRPVGNRRLYEINADAMVELERYARSFWSAAMTRYARTAQQDGVAGSTRSEE